MRGPQGTLFRPSIEGTQHNGVANWLDASGLQSGFGILRWQSVPPEMTAAGLVRALHILPVAQAAALPGIARITSARRREQLAARVTGYNDRTG